jgi:hypothetical protein
MEKLDALFLQRDLIAEQRNTATLSKAFQEVIAYFFKQGGSTIGV